jgi:hypothetical protein
MFADYRLLRGPQDKMPPMKEGILYEYILAENGVFCMPSGPAWK